MCTSGEAKMRKGCWYVEETWHPFVVVNCKRERERESLNLGMNNRCKLFEGGRGF